MGLLIIKTDAESLMWTYRQSFFFQSESDVKIASCHSIYGAMLQDVFPLCCQGCFHLKSAALNGLRKC